MSPDETTIAPPTETGEAEATPKKSLKDRMAFLDKGGKSMDKVPGLNRIPRPMRVLLIFLFIVLIVVIIFVAWPSEEGSTPGPNNVNVDKLEDWSWSSGSMQADFLNEGRSFPYALSQMVEGNGTVFIEKVDVTITWTDEPDGSIGPRTKENQPDTFQLEINGTANVSAMSDQMSNTHGQSQSISLSVSVSASGYEYLVMGNTTGLQLGDEVTTGELDIIVHMIEAGDHSSPPQVLIILDNGNDYSIEISATGKVLPD